VSGSSRLVYVVHGPEAVKAESISLEKAGFREVQDLQEWVIAHPEVLGDDVLIVTSEFDQWSSESGATARERLDILGLDASGRLVVVELKRGGDRAIHLQALTYAALVAGFDEQRLADVYAAFRTKRHQPTDREQALDLLRNHVEGTLDADVLSVPRIVLVAGEYPPQVLTTVVWLTRRDLDIELREVRAYRLGESIAVTFDRVYPTPGVDDLLLAPAQRETATAAKKVDEQARAANACRVIVERGLLAAGTPLTLRPTNEVDEATRTAIIGWVAEDPTRGTATWVEDAVRPIRWDYDQTQWRPTTLVRNILVQACGVDRGVRGTAWWTTPAGLGLTDVAFGKGGRDWTDVHDLIGLIGPGHWTSYGDIAQVVGVPARAVGTHISTCPNCPDGAHRVLTTNGTPSDGFHWTDSDDVRDIRQVLEEEGLRFGATGTADPAQHLSAVGLTTLRRAAV